MRAEDVLLYAEDALRLLFGALAIWSMLRWLRTTLDMTRTHSEALVRAQAPDATPYELLPNAEQRVNAIESWESLRAQRIGWLWDAQVARMLALCAAIAALAAWGSLAWPPWGWVTLGVLSLAPLYKVSQLNDQRRQALAALASRRDKLVSNIHTPSAG